TESECFARWNAATWNGTARRAGHQGIDVRVVPHVERARGTSSDCNAPQRDEPDYRMHMTGRDCQADEGREHHERHDSRLHQSHVVADRGNVGPSAHCLDVGGAREVNSAKKGHGSYAHDHHRAAAGIAVLASEKIWSRGRPSPPGPKHQKIESA